MITQRERDYIVWQNRAFRFYLASRLLYQKEQHAPAAFCAIQAIELLLKATLVYWDKSFDPEAAKHRIAGLIRTVRNKVRGAKEFEVPEYFHFQQRYYSVSRYPKNRRGILIPASFLPDLDIVFTQLLQLVPFQFNSELSRALAGRNNADLTLLRRHNSSMRHLRKHCMVKAAAPHDPPLKPATAA